MADRPAGTMMNPYTQFLLEGVHDPDLIEFVRWWDAYESLLIDVYRGRLAPAAVSGLFAEIKSAVLNSYPRWEPELRPLWQNLQIRGKPLSQDPFRVLVGLQGPEDFVENWSALQTLPPAREALNLYLQEHFRAGGE